MKSFSERMGYKEEKGVQFESLDQEIRNRIFNVLNTRIENLYNKDQMYKYMADEFFKVRHDYHYSHYAKKLEGLILEGEWHQIYSCIEFFATFADTASGVQNRYTFDVDINYVLKSEVAGYRLVDGIITPITDSNEIETISNSLNTVYDAVNTHMKKALSFFSDRESPDYENSIKESISAVESIACIIVGNDRAVLSSALDRLTQKGVRIHEAQKKAFKNLYGYTSDENGIRHAGIDFNGATLEDAKFMLVSCSAFVHYLIEKYNKVIG